MTKQINTGVAELLLVKVPEDSHDIDYRNGVKLLSWLTKYSQSYDGIDFYEPEYDCELLGIAHELTEKVWATVLPYMNGLGDYNYIDFVEGDPNGFKTATESGLSLLMANECYAVNPYGRDEPEGIKHIGVFAQLMRQKHKLWNQAQQNTGKWILLRKL